LLNQKLRTLHGAERETVSKRSKTKQKLSKVMMPNLSGVKFEDAVRALLQTPPPKRKKSK
jgi:hypothetical protein